MEREMGFLFVSDTYYIVTRIFGDGALALLEADFRFKAPDCICRSFFNDGYSIEYLYGLDERVFRGIYITRYFDKKYGFYVKIFLDGDEVRLRFRPVPVSEGMELLLESQKYGEEAIEFLLKEYPHRLVDLEVGE